jgi:hypothetical protein
MNAKIPFFKLIRLKETELRNLGVTPFEVRQRIINAAQQCLAKYDFQAPFYTDNSFSDIKSKSTVSRFFKDTVPLSDPINQNPVHPSP